MKYKGALLITGVFLASSVYAGDPNSSEKNSVPTGDFYAPQGNHIIAKELPLATDLEKVQWGNSETEVKFQWDLSNSNDYANILIYRNGLYHRRYSKNTLSNNQFIDDNLNPDSYYTYQVRTESINGQVSKLSSPLTIHTESFSTPLPRSLRAYTRSYDMSYIDLNPYNCEPDENNAGVSEFGNFYYGQTHLYQPTNIKEIHTTNLDGSKLKKIKDTAFKTGITAGRPTLVELQAKGAGKADAVKVQVYYKETLVGSICMQPPEKLNSTYPKMLNQKNGLQSEVNSQALADVYHGYLMPEWVRPGMSLRLVSSKLNRQIPANMIRIEPATTYHLFDLNMEYKGTYAHKRKNRGTISRYYKGQIDSTFRKAYQWHATHPSKDMLITTFPYVVEAQPYRISHGSIKEIGMRDSAITYEDWGDRAASGVSSTGKGIGGGFIRAAAHELGHATGLPHLGKKKFYPYGINNNPSVLPNVKHHMPMIFNTFHNVVQQYQKDGKTQLVNFDNDYAQRVINRNLAKWSRWDYNVKIPKKYKNQVNRERGAYVVWQWQDIENNLGRFVVNEDQFKFNSVFPKQRNVDVINYSGVYDELDSLKTVQEKGLVDLSYLDPKIFELQETMWGPIGNVDFFYRARGDLGVLNHPLYLNAHYIYADDGDAEDDSFINNMRNNPGSICREGCNVIAIVNFADGSKITRLLPDLLERIDPRHITIESKKDSLKFRKKYDRNGVARPYRFYFSTLDKGVDVSSYKLCELPLRIFNSEKTKSSPNNIQNLSNDDVRNAYSRCNTLIEEDSFTKEVLPEDKWEYVSDFPVSDPDFFNKAFSKPFRDYLLMPRLLQPTVSDFKHEIFQHSIDKSHIKTSYLTTGKSALR